MCLVSISSTNHCNLIPNPRSDSENESISLLLFCPVVWVGEEIREGKRRSSEAKRGKIDEKGVERKSGKKWRPW